MMPGIYFKIIWEWEVDGVTDDAILAITGHCCSWVMGTLGFIILHCDFCIYLIFYHINSSLKI